MADEAEHLGAPAPEDTPPAPEGRDAAPPEGGEAPAAPSVEELARDLGWKPQTEWKGDTTRWTPADQFLRDKVHKSEQLGKDIGAVKDRLDRLARTSASIVKREVESEKARLQQAHAAAVQRGDVRAAHEASRALDRVGQEVQGGPSDEGDAYAAFVERNPWFESDEAARALAIGIGEQNKQLPPAEQFRKAEEAVRKAFPQHFGAVEQPKPFQPHTNTPGSRSASPAPREKGVADLPPEARKAGADLIRAGMVADMPSYAKAYWKENT